MCHAVRVKLSPSERKAAVRLTGIMVPIYASVVLAIAVGLSVFHIDRPGRVMTASSDRPAAEQSTGR
jgi:hypothetical protein